MGLCLVPQDLILYGNLPTISDLACLGHEIYIIYNSVQSWDGSDYTRPGLDWWSKAKVKSEFDAKP